jgi:hypothetical protein
MARQNRKKLNHLLKNWPRGTVAVHSWLEQQGISRQLAEAYVNSEWIVRIDRGAFIRADDHVEWTGGVQTLQHQVGLQLHVAAKTALQLQGYAHFLPLGQDAPATLFGSPGVKLPGWFRQYPWDVRLRYTSSNLFPYEDGIGLTTKDFDTYAINISSPERAIMEVIHLVPHQESLDEALLLMEGLNTLRPALVGNLLKSCRSIKVKRFFMYLAEKYNHPWVKRLDTSCVDFGSGKRVIAPCGQWNSKYNITVPKDSEMT